MNRDGLRLPDFIAVGPPRTGTTWLDRVLRGHAGLPAGVKETQFFTWRYHLGLGWYAAHFRDCPPDARLGELGPWYFTSAEARTRIAHDLPQCKILITLRDPVERLYSHYKIWRQMGATKASFERVASHHKEFLSFNDYAHHIREWRRQFGDENVLVAIYEDSHSDQQGYIDRICSFVGLPKIDLATIPWQRERVQVISNMPKNHRLARRARAVKGFLHRRRWYGLAQFLNPAYTFCSGRGEQWPPLDAVTRARLRDQFRPQIEDLEALLQRDLSMWKSESSTMRPHSEDESGSHGVAGSAKAG
jgi:hypothetical protein